MATIDERVAHLEGQVESQLRGLDDLRDLVRQVNTRVGGLDLRVDRRLAEIDEKFDRRCSELEQKFDRRLDVMDQRLLRLDDKISRQFVWVVGTQVAVLIAVIGALVGT